MVDKNEAIIKYLLNCPTVYANRLFFNFANEKDNDNQIYVYAQDISLNHKFVDGSVMKQYTFSLLTYKAIAQNPVVKADGYKDENVTDMLDIQEILDWIDEQESDRNYPNFGEDCVVDKIEALTNEPKLVGVDNKTAPTLAQYSTDIRVTYIDYSKVLWK